MSSEYDQPERPAKNGKPKHPVTKLDGQIDLVVRAFAEADIRVGVERLPTEELDYLYQRQVILVRDAYLDAVRTVVGGGAAVDGLIDGVTVYSLEGADIPEVIAALRAIDEQLGVGAAAPNHVLWVSVAGMCPATEPEEVSAGAGPDPGICPDRHGSGVYVYVADTGLLADGPLHPWLAGVTGDDDPVPAGSPIPPYTGHGAFVAGVARCMAPASQMFVASLLHFAGAQLESEIVKQLDRALSQGPDIISLSAGATTRRDLPPLAFEALWQRYRHYKGVQLVAAASNNGDRRPFWPAAFPQVVSVGALAAGWRSRASFSDYGGWVDVYAPGEGLVNAYATGTYECREPPNTGQVRQFHGMARWSGTSFSTPMVAGLIAARMSRTGENSQQAADALLRFARARALPGVGPVLYPCDSGEDHRHPADCCCQYRHHLCAMLTATGFSFGAAAAR
jgi:subtilisin family serine protease